jgi:hypothetical protein
VDRDFKNRFLQAHDPSDREQQQHPRAHRQAQTDQAAFFPLFLGQAVDEDGDENDVVDAEHDFQQCQRQECAPGLRVGEPVEFKE